MYSVAAPSPLERAGERTKRFHHTIVVKVLIFNHKGHEGFFTKTTGFMEVLRAQGSKLRFVRYRGLRFVSFVRQLVVHCEL